MIELTTGVIFLMSSLYGAGHVNADVQPITIDSFKMEQAISEASSFTDPKTVEAYVRATYADKPILVDIARCESNFKQFDENGQVIRGRVNKGDVGVMQINEKYHADEAVKLGLNIYTIEGNLAFAKHLYDTYGVEPWTYSSKCWTGTGELAVNK